jgi:hypothetical protein
LRHFLSGVLPNVAKHILDFIHLTLIRNGYGCITRYRQMNHLIKSSLHTETMEAVDELMNKYFQVAKHDDVCREIAYACLEYCEGEIPGKPKVVVTLSKLFEEI